MKTVCKICKTEYTLNSVTNSSVRCAVCSHVWNATIPRRRNPFLVFIASLCALMAASIFTFVIVSKHNLRVIQKNPLVAEISKITKKTNDLGVEQLVVNGFIKNKSENLYGVPDLIITSLDKNENIIAKQPFFASATLLEAGKTATFSHTLSVPTVNVRKITVELKK